VDAADDVADTPPYRRSWLHDGRAALETELAALARRFDRLGAEAIAIPATYVEAIALRR
jgi:hypothetical protein